MGDLFYPYAPRMGGDGADLVSYLLPDLLRSASMRGVLGLRSSSCCQGPPQLLYPLFLSSGSFSSSPPSIFPMSLVAPREGLGEEESASWLSKAGRGSPRALRPLGWEWGAGGGGEKGV